MHTVSPSRRNQHGVEEHGGWFRCVDAMMAIVHLKQLSVQYGLGHHFSSQSLHPAWTVTRFGGYG
jgi:hypothetical protein